MKRVNLKLLLALCGLGLNGVGAQTVLNPSFEADTFANSPGYVAGNTAITNWSTTNLAQVGINPAGGNPFADNGTVPAGTNVGFLQGTGANLSAPITGLTVGVKYKVNFRVNARGGNLPTLRVVTDGIGDPMDAWVQAVGGTNPYQYVAYEFTATATTQNLTVSNLNQQGGDNTLLVDDFSVVPSSGAWSYAAWNDDASSGVDKGFFYSHAFTFGSAADYATLNGVGFVATPGGNPTIPGRFSTAGLPNPFGGVGRTMTGASNTVGQSFIYGGPNMSITLNGLKPNTAYVATIFGVAFDVSTTYARTATFSSSLTPNDRLTVDLDHFGQQHGIRVNLSYTTDATGNVTLSYDQLGNGSWHTSAFCNREVVRNGWSQQKWAGDATSGVDSSKVYTHALSFGSATSTTINGVPFTGADGGNPSGANFSLTNFDGVFAGDINNITTAGGGSAAVATDFIYNGFPGVINLTGLTPGQSYQLTLFSVGWEAPGARQAIFGAPDDRMLADQDFYGDNVGTRFDYHYVADASGNLTVTTTPTGGASIHLYGLCNRADSVLPANNPWTIQPWTGNSTSGINSDAVYTHAYNFGSTTNAVINGVTFLGTSGGNPSAANYLSSAPNVFGGDANSITTSPSSGSGSTIMASDFLYGGNPGGLLLSGLTPGTEYLLSLFTVGWDNVNGRLLLFNGEAGSKVFDQDTYGNDAGVRIDYRYTANSSGYALINVAPQVPGATMHIYGFANREYIFFPSLKVLTPPENAYVTALGDAATFTVAADGQPTLSYQWQKGGVDISDDAKYSGTTTPTLTVSNVAPADVALYRVKVTGGGAQGSVLSSTATIVLITDPVPGLFGTGMGANCTTLADGANDPHFLLLTNPDGDTLVPAVVEDGSQWPIVAGPWLANSATSKWIGPRSYTIASAPGVYVYQTTVDLTGFDLSTVRITGRWTSDNQGQAIKVNDGVVGVTNPVTGITSSGNFTALSTFTISSANATFVDGINTIDFYINNDGGPSGTQVGPTGFRLDDFKGFGVIPAGTAPHIAVSPADTSVARNGTTCLMVSASGSAPLTYQWKLNNVDITGATSSTLAITADAFAKAGNYTVTVSNGSGTTTSSAGVLTILNAAPVAAPDFFITAKGAPITISSAALLSNDTDADLDILTVATFSTPSSGNNTAVTGGVTYTPVTNFTGDATFTYGINDGWGGTATGTVTVTVLAGNIPAAGVLDYTNSGDRNNLRFIGLPGGTYLFQRSTNLLDWTTVQTLIAPGSGLLECIEPNPVEPRLFHRMAVP